MGLFLKPRPIRVTMRGAMVKSLNHLVYFGGAEGPIWDGQLYRSADCQAGS